MADKRSISDATIADIRRRFVAGEPKKTIAHAMGLDRETVQKYTVGIDVAKEQAKLHTANVSKGLPEEIVEKFEHFNIDTVGRWLLLSDLHFPFHNRKVIETAIDRAKKDGVVGVILNGDILDSHEVSDFDKEPTAPRYVKEIEQGNQFLDWLDGKLPTARIIYKEGNHEERLKRYIIKRAPALFGLDVVTLPALLDFKQRGVEWVGDKRVIRLGNLAVIHGHEFQRGISAPVNPARGFFLRGKECVIGGHHHQTSEHHGKTLSGKQRAAWSTGCCCGLHPPYMPVNEWNLGYAMVELFDGGEFDVRNVRV